MRAGGLVITFVVLIVLASAWEEGDYDDEEDVFWNPRPASNGAVISWHPPGWSSTTRRPGTYRPASPPPPASSEECDTPTTARANSASVEAMADRIYAQLMREYKGSPSAIVSGLEIRFNVRASGDLIERLWNVCDAAIARLSVTYGDSARPVMVSVAHRIAADIQATGASSGTININVRLGQGQRPGTATIQVTPVTSNTNSNTNNNNNRQATTASSQRTSSSSRTYWRRTSTRNLEDGSPQPSTGVEELPLPYAMNSAESLQPSTNIEGPLPSPENQEVPVEPESMNEVDSVLSAIDQQTTLPTVAAQ